MPSYRLQYVAAWAITVVLAFTTFILAANPDDLGIPPVAFRWVAIVAGALGMIGQLLPSLRRPPVADDNPGGTTRDPQPRDE